MEYLRNNVSKRDTFSRMIGLACFSVGLRQEGPQNIRGTSRTFHSLAVAGQLEQMRCWHELQCKEQTCFEYIGALHQEACDPRRLLKKFIREKERTRQHG